MKQVLQVLFLMVIKTAAFSQEVYIKHIAATVDSLAANLVHENEPGLSLGVVYQGQPILNSHYGLMNLNYGMKTSDSTAYNLASVSKHITAFGILLLETEGKLNLQDMVGSYLPDLPKEYKEITINQLLHHTSGIPSTDNLKLFAGIPLDTPWTMAEEMELLKAYSQLNFEPGTEYMYSNGGYSFLAAVIEAASCQNFADFFHQKVFEPLNLKAEVYNRPGEVIKYRAKGYKWTGEGFIEAMTEAESVPGGSNFYFNMDDMLVWMNLILQKSPPYSQQVSTMMKPSFLLTTGDSIPYSFGFNIKDYKGVKAIYHGGGTPGFASYMMLFPEQELGITLLTNNENINVGQVIRALADGILADFLEEERPVEKKTISLPGETMNKWVGSYRMKDGLIIKVARDSGKLFLKIPEAQRFELHPESETDYFITEFDARVIFSQTSGGKPGNLKLVQGSKIQQGKYIEPKDLSQSSPSPDAVTGSYYQKELDVTYRVILEDGELVLKLPDTFHKYLHFSSATLKPMAGDVFNTDRLGVVEFLRDEKNKIDGLRFNDVGRLRSISFTRTR